MGKREEVKKPRLERDFYSTIDPDAVSPLSFLRGKSYIEPCAGSNSLVKLLGDDLNHLGSYDVSPQDEQVVKKNCLDLTEEEVKRADIFITNPPFNRVSLEPIIDHLSSLLPTFLLLPADMMHNKYMSRHLLYCPTIVSVGRLYWFLKEGKKVKGVDNYAWYTFDKRYRGRTEFVGR